MACLGGATIFSGSKSRATDSALVSTSGSDYSCHSFDRVSTKVLKRKDFDVQKYGKLVAVRAVTHAPVQSDEYNQMMKRQMMNPYEYHHELGMYYSRMDRNIIVGSQPQSKEEVDQLFHGEGVGAVLCLQQDKDIQYWGIDFNSITRRCEELGLWHIRRPAKDFDGNSLRHELPSAVSALDHAISQGKTVYVHCTAGLGRAPAVAIAYYFWFHKMNLDAAYKLVASKRPCGPKKDAIRGATYDLAKNDPWKAPFEQLPDFAFSDVASWERQLIHERVRNLRWS